MSDAFIGYGSVLKVHDDGSPPQYVSVGEVTDITPPSATVDQVDVTHMQSPNRRREFIDGLVDGGECSFTLNYVPNSAGDVLLRGILATPVGESRVRSIQITYPNGAIDTFDGNLQSYEPTLPTDDKATATVTFKVTGDVVRS